MTSPQMANLFKRYGVTTEAELIKAIQDEYERETDFRPPKAVTQSILDQMLEAEYQRIAGGAYDA
jgi:hypothetical protein